MTSEGLNQLLMRRRALEDQIADAKADLAVLQDHINQSMSERVVQELDEKGKSYGQVTFTVEDFKVTGEVKKKVSWNNEAMKSAASACQGVCAVGDYFDVKLTMKEDKYGSLDTAAAANPERFGPIKKLVDEARTVEFADPIITKIEVE